MRRLFPIAMILLPAGILLAQTSTTAPAAEGVGAAILTAALLATLLFVVAGLALVVLISAGFLGSLLIMGMLNTPMLAAFAQRSLHARFRSFLYQLSAAAGTMLGLASGGLAWLIIRPPQQGYLLLIAGGLSGAVLAAGVCWLVLAVVARMAHPQITPMDAR